MARYSNHIFLDIMGDLVFVKSFDTPGSGGDAQITEASREGIRLLCRAARCNYVVAALPALADWEIEQWLPLGACIALGNGIWRVGMHRCKRRRKRKKGKEKKGEGGLYSDFCYMQGWFIFHLYHFSRPQAYHLYSCTT